MDLPTPHRAFVSLELPFTVPIAPAQTPAHPISSSTAAPAQPTGDTADAVAAAVRQQCESFAPACFLLPFFADRPMSVARAAEAAARRQAAETVESFQAGSDPQHLSLGKKRRRKSARGDDGSGRSHHRQVKAEAERDGESRNDGGAGDDDDDDDDGSGGSNSSDDDSGSGSGGGGSGSDTDEEDGEEEEEGEENNEDLNDGDEQSNAEETAGGSHPPKRRRRYHHRHRFGIRFENPAFAFLNPEEYAAAPVHTDWRGTDWGKTVGGSGGGGRAASSSSGATTAATAAAATAGAGDDGAAQLAAERRVALFPSSVPQLLYRGYYRNDLLVRVTTERRVRRYRDRRTGAIVREETITEDKAKGEHEGTTATDAADVAACPDDKTRVEVVGVVSRELEMSRPADFAFAAWEHNASGAAEVEAPHRGVPFFSPNLYPPVHFMLDLSRPEVAKASGHQLNDAVLQQVVRECLAAGKAAPSAAAAAAVLGTEVPNLLPLAVEAAAEGKGYHSRHASTWRFRSATVTPEQFRLSGPPPPIDVQRSFLAEARCGVDLRYDPVATPRPVQVAAQLLSVRPVWRMGDVASAMSAVGGCPSLFTNRGAVSALTYVITSGPFNRMRIRHGYNPYAAPAGALYQNLNIRIVGTTPVGTRLQDLMRSPHIGRAMQLLEAEAAAEDGGGAVPGVLLDATGPVAEELRAALSLPHRSCTRHCVLAMLRSGKLYSSLQLIDLMDHPGICGVVLRAVAATAASDASRSVAALTRNRYGWISEADMRKLNAMIVATIDDYADALTGMLARCAAEAAAGGAGASVVPPSPSLRPSTAAAAGGPRLAGSAAGSSDSDSEDGGSGDSMGVGGGRSGPGSLDGSSSDKDGDGGRS